MASQQWTGENVVNSSRPARRLITTAAVGLLAAGTLASCGGNESSPNQFNPPAGAAPPAATSKPPPTTQPPTTKPPATKPRPTTKPPARAGSGDRLGCRTYCQAAGILNGGAGGDQPAVTIVSSGTVTADADGYVPVVLTCNLTVQCQGALVLSLNRPGFQEQGYIAGKSDVVLDAGATTTLGVPLDEVALSWLQSHGSTDFGVLIDAGLSFGCDGMAWSPDSPTRLGLPPCGGGPIDGFDVFSAGDLNAAAPG